MKKARTYAVSIACVSLLVLSGCAAPRTSPLYGIPNAASAPPAGEAARVFVSACVPGPGQPIPPPVEPAFAPAAAILAPLAGAVAQQTLSAVGKGLIAAGNEQTISLTSLAAVPSLRRIIATYRDNTCLHFLVGSFRDSASTINAESPRNRNAYDNIVERLGSSGIFLTAPPRLHLEYKVIADGGSSPARMLRFVESSRTIDGSLAGTSLWTSRRELGVMILISPSGTKISEAGQMQIPPETIRQRTSRWFSRETLRAAPTTQWLELTEDVASKPINVVFVVAETRDAIWWLTVAGNALQSDGVTTAVRETVVTATQQALDPAARRTAQIQAQNTARTQLDEALTLAENARAAIADASGCTDGCPIKVTKAREYARLARARFQALRLPPPELDTSGLGN